MPTMPPASELVEQFAPVICCDEREPFPPLRAGWSVYRASGPSPSFQRIVEVEPPAARVIEYAIWFDWDISHLNELEHVWVYLDGQARVLGCEGSWHGFYRGMTPGDGLLLADGHPLVYALPGKHSFAAQPDGFDESRAECERDCGPLAGRGGVQVTHLTLGKIEKTPETDALARAYLQRRRFTPAWQFARRVTLGADMLAPWDSLAAEIPQRVNDWIACLRAGMTY
jgi:hypothetical protein